MSIIYVQSDIRMYPPYDDGPFAEECWESESHHARIYRWCRGLSGVTKIPEYDIKVPPEIWTRVYYTRNDRTAATTFLDCPLDRVVRCV